MGIARIEGVNESGVEFIQIEELTIYTIKSKEDQISVVNKLNRQIIEDLDKRKISLSPEEKKKYLFAVEEELQIEYPYSGVVDLHEMIALTDVIAGILPDEVIKNMLPFKI